ncbi:MAG: TolC family protein [Candidatus Acidiferrales bacterium]
MKIYFHLPALTTLIAVIVLVPASLPAQTSQNLTLQDAEHIAIQNHPQIQAAIHLASAAKSQVTEARSAYYPTVDGSLTGADAQSNSRIAAGGLNNPIIYDRYANGVEVSQLLTDFGRTHELVKSSDLHAQAQQENVETSRAGVLLQVDQAYYGVLKAQSVLTVAEQAVKQRQLVSDQITELQKNKLRSGLDVSFANVNLAQAQLLLIQAQNDLQSSFARLSAALGYSDQRTFHLTEEPVPAPPPANLSDLIQQALRDRPELIGERFNVNSAQSYATAERDLKLPTISALGAAGLVPVNEAPLAPRYAAAAFNVNVPIFNGHLFGALHSEANARAQAESDYLRDAQNQVVRDLQAAWLNANSAFQRLSVTRQLLDQANKSLDLAQARYNLGLSSIIELSQAQLNQTQAQIEQASSKYDYEAQTSALNYQLGALH